MLGISTDPVNRNANFAEKEAAQFLLLSDEDGRIGRAYGAIDDPEGKTEKRISYVIGPDGKIVEAYDRVKAAGHAEEVLSSLTSKA